MGVNSRIWWRGGKEEEGNVISGTHAREQEMPMVDRLRPLMADNCSKLPVSLIITLLLIRQSACTLETAVVDSCFL